MALQNNLWSLSITRLVGEPARPDILIQVELYTVNFLKSFKLIATLENVAVQRPHTHILFLNTEHILFVVDLFLTLLSVRS